jgi:hypothetical protein
MTLSTLILISITLILYCICLFISSGLLKLCIFTLKIRKACQCGYCREYTLDKLTWCLVKNTIYSGPSGCFESEENTQTKLCKKCLKESKKENKLIKIYRV